MKYTMQTDPLITDLLKMAKSIGLTYTEIGRQIGYATSTIKHWTNRTKPRDRDYAVDSIKKVIADRINEIKTEAIHYDIDIRNH